MYMIRMMATPLTPQLVKLLRLSQSKEATIGITDIFIVKEASNPEQE
jgi:hypothetical protein